MLLRLRNLRSQYTPHRLNHRYLHAQNVNQKLMHIFDTSGKKESIDSLLKNDLTIWNDALSNEIGRLSQGIRNVKGNNAIDFIPLSEVLRNKNWPMQTWFVIIGL